MIDLEEYLKESKSLLEKGTVIQPITIRELINACGAQRRGVNVLTRIGQTLARYGLTTDPSYEYAYIDEPVNLIIDRGSSAEHEQIEIYRVGMLESANRVPLAVSPDSTIEKAATIMLANDFSQLPVLTTPHEIKGVVTWKTIGRSHALHIPCTAVRDCMEEAKVLDRDSSLFRAIKVVIENEYVLVRALDRTICGIVTGSDMSLQFRELAEPFLMISEIEAGIRRLLSDKFTQTELQSAKDPSDTRRVVSSVHDLSFGEYLRLLEYEEKWKKLKVTFDQKYFLSLLRGVAGTRNDIMHFDPQGIEPEAMAQMRTLLRLVKSLRKMTVI